MLDPSATLVTPNFLNQLNRYKKVKKFGRGSLGVVLSNGGKGKRRLEKNCKKKNSRKEKSFCDQWSADSKYPFLHMVNIGHFLNTQHFCLIYPPRISCKKSLSLSIKLKIPETHFPSPPCIWMWDRLRVYHSHQLLRISNQKFLT